MPKLNFCASLSWLYQEESDLIKRFNLAKLDGFSAVEIAFPYDYSIEDLVSAKKQSSLKVVLINSGDSKSLGNAANSSNQIKFLNELEKAIKFAKALECTNIHLMAGKVTNKENMKDAKATFISNLKMASEKLKKEGLIGLIEPINKFDVPDYFLNDFYQAIDILKQVNEPNIKLQFDFYHQQYMSGGLINKFKSEQDKIGHLQISQLPNRSEPSASGEINYKYIFDILESSSYSGWIGLEYKPSKNTTDSLNWFKSY